MSAATDAPPTTAPDPSARPRVRLAALSAALAAALAVPRWISLPPFPTCTFKAWTGHPCPGCGMTRSFFHLALGDLPGSLRFHPLGLPLGLLLLALTIGALGGAVAGRDPVWDLCRRRATPLALAFVGLLLTTWVVRTWVCPQWSPDPIGPPVWAAR